MKLIIAILLALSFLQPNVTTPISLAEQAEAAYLSGNYQAAVDLYQELLSVIQTGEVYFNLGNAYYELGDDGYALANYLRAAEYMPRDEDLRRSLALIRSRRVNPIEGNLGFWESISNSSKEALNSTELALVIIGLWWILCGLLMLNFTRFQRQFLSRALLVVSSAVFLVIVLIGGIRFAIESLHPYAVIVTENAQAMSGPGADYVDLFVLYSADEIRIIQRENGWVRVRLPNLREGWILADQLEEI